MEDQEPGGTAVQDPEVVAAADSAVARADEPPAATGRDAGRRMAERVQRASGDDVRVVEDEHREAMDRVGEGRADEDDVSAATEWLLADEQQVNTRKLRVRLGGSDDNPLESDWIIRAIGVDVIRAAEREATGNRAQRRSPDGGYDELKANLRVVAEGTVSPDLKDLARQRGFADPVVLLRQRFQYRSGVLTQIAGEVMSLSGFDGEDVRAAGNS